MVGVITLEKALKTFAGELGAEVDARESLLDSITASIEFLMLHGGGDLLREWRLPLQFGRFALPRDLSIPIKYKFGEVANFGFGGFYSPYFSYSSHGVVDYRGFYDFNPKFSISPNPTSVQFQPPCRVRLMATTRNTKDVGKQLIVGGKQGDKDIAGLHFGRKTPGEVITIYAEDDPEKKCSAYEFSEITSVVKDETCDYVMLSGLACDDQVYHLSFYHPDETVPRYTQGVLVSGGQAFPSYCFVHILGRVNPSVIYRRDADILPIDSYEMLDLLAKRARYNSSSDLDLVANYEVRIKNLIRKSVAYKQAPNRSPSVSLRGSGYTLSNL